VVLFHKGNQFYKEAKKWERGLLKEAREKKKRKKRKT
jgi:hypothetical protein